MTNYCIIVSMLSQFFAMLANCLVLFVLFNLIHGFLDRLTDVGKPYAAVTVIQWVTLTVLSLLSIVSWSMYVALQVMLVNSDVTFDYSVNYIRLESARDIIFWIISLEVVAWAFFVNSRAGTRRFPSKVSTITPFCHCHKNLD